MGNRMVSTFLQDIIEDISLSILPYNWNSFELESFSKNKHLWDFQQKAVENAIKLLWKYYEDIKDFQKGEELSTNHERIKKITHEYVEFEDGEEINIKDLDYKLIKSLIWW